MPYEHKVIAVQDDVQMPSPLQWPAAQRQQFAESLEETLNHMSREKWEFV